MSNFIEFNINAPDNLKVSIRIDAIIAIDDSPGRENESTLTLSSGNYQIVEHSHKEVLQLISAALL